MCTKFQTVHTNSIHLRFTMKDKRLQCVEKVPGMNVKALRSSSSVKHGWSIKGRASSGKRGWSKGVPSIAKHGWSKGEHPWET